MRRILTTALVMIVMCGTAAAGGVGVFGSYWETTDDDEGAGAGARMTLGGNLALDLAFTFYDEVNVPPLDLPGQPSLRIEDLQVLPFDIGVRYTFVTGSRFRPFVGGGISYFSIDAEGTRTDDEVGFYVLGGLRYGPEEGLNLLAELMWREAEGTIHVDTGHGIAVSRSVDTDFGGPGINLGIMLAW